MWKIGGSALLTGALLLSACGGAPAPSTPAPASAEGGSADGAEGTSVIQGRVRSGDMASDRSHYESVVEMLRGRVPGVQVIEGEGRTLEIRIRGVNQSMGVASGQEPLVVVDGVPSSRSAGEALLDLNPEDVSSIDVLRDVASTSIYGTRGANGVIVVRLKRRR